MSTSISDDRLRKFSASVSGHFSDAGESVSVNARRPVHTIYGGAHLFNAETTRKLSALAVRALDDNADDADDLGELFDIPPTLRMSVYERVARKLAAEAIEDLRIDFEDGYGPRSDEEEDAHAAAAAAETAAALTAGTLPPFFGIRIKPLGAAEHRRSLRTLDIFLTGLARTNGGRLPDHFVVTLPKVVAAEQIAVLVDALDEMENAPGIAAGSVKIEIMVETPRSIVSPDGICPLASFHAAARGRLRGAHFGAYDYTAALGVAARAQHLFHPACDHARSVMQAAYADVDVWLADGATNTIPVGPHRGRELSPGQIEENRRVVRREWRTHYDNCRRSLANGFYQSWDLHPAQLVPRYAAVYSFFLEGAETAGRRLAGFIEQASRASLVGSAFDDAATGRGLVNFFARAVNCGAMTPADILERTGLDHSDILNVSFTLPQPAAEK